VHATELVVPGRELGGVHLAMEYLEQQNRFIASGAGGPAPSISAHGKRVVIIGGGDTGSDCLGTAHRQGCESVHQLELLPKPPASRAPQTPWPQWPLQLRTSHAHEEGCQREWSISTLKLTGEGGRVRKLHAKRVDTGEELTIDCELVLLAMGFTGLSARPSTRALVDGLGLKLDARGNVQTDGSFRTSNPKVYAAGDARRGASLIVWAIAEGRKMAAFIDRELKI
jgi:glutamate synthase (NADPH/NADH) small chain